MRHPDTPAERLVVDRERGVGRSTGMLSGHRDRRWSLGPVRVVDLASVFTHGALMLMMGRNYDWTKRFRYLICAL